MKKKVLISIAVLLAINWGYSQTKSEIEILLNEIATIENSKNIVSTDQAQWIIGFGENSLSILSYFFADTSLTNIYSECEERNLTKGEISIILADHIKRMPYFTLTGIQNCLLTYCESNPNFIEYYLWAIKRDGTEEFIKKYRDWLAWTKLPEKEKRKIERKETREFRKQQRELRRSSRS
ncbi:MAG: hypothetical protein KTR22_08725 [Flavobacteriaceae bacterium]|nr:hypothetical protein [Flavobacteriaceae bacterium]